MFTSHSFWNNLGIIVWDTWQWRCSHIAELSKSEARIAHVRLRIGVLRKIICVQAVNDDVAPKFLGKSYFSIFSGLADLSLYIHIIYIYIYMCVCLHTYACECVCVWHEVFCFKIMAIVNRIINQWILRKGNGNRCVVCVFCFTCHLFCLFFLNGAIWVKHIALGVS